MSRKPLVVAMASMLVVALWASTAVAKPVTFTFHAKKATETFRDVFPCIGNGDEVATITITANSVFHVTAAGIDENDNFIPPYHLTGTTTGTFVADPDKASLPTYKGRFTQWFGENSNRKNFTATFTFTIRGKGSDGSRVRFHVTAHVSMNANGVVKSEFEKVRCF